MRNPKLYAPLTAIVLGLLAWVCFRLSQSPALPWFTGLPAYNTAIGLAALAGVALVAAVSPSVRAGIGSGGGWAARLIGRARRVDFHPCQGRAGADKGYVGCAGTSPILPRFDRGNRSPFEHFQSACMSFVAPTVWRGDRGYCLLGCIRLLNRPQHRIRSNRLLSSAFHTHLPDLPIQRPSIHSPICRLFPSYVWQECRRQFSWLDWLPIELLLLSPHSSASLYHTRNAIRA